MDPHQTAQRPPSSTGAIPPGAPSTVQQPVAVAVETGMPAVTPPLCGGVPSSPAADQSLLEHHPVERWTPGSSALLSAVLPGAGQAAQRRWGTAALHVATVASYLAGALVVGGGRAFWLALAWNAWSAVDAYWHGRD
jgi:hypothetical protein